MTEAQMQPFILVEHEKSTSVIMSQVGTYKQKIFDSRADEGFEGNGYDWGSLAAVFLEEKLPQLQDKISFDPEADMFCAYSSDKAALVEFSRAFRSMCDDESLMLDLFSRAELD